jgi:hypothetical protein
MELLMATKTLAANMRRCFIDRKGATIGGGKFTPEELKEGAIALNEHQRMKDMLNAIANTQTNSNSDPDDMGRVLDSIVADATKLLKELQ